MQVFFCKFLKFFYIYGRLMGEIAKKLDFSWMLSRGILVFWLWVVVVVCVQNIKKTPHQVRGDMWGAIPDYLITISALNVCGGGSSTQAYATTFNPSTITTDNAMHIIFFLISQHPYHVKFSFEYHGIRLLPRNSSFCCLFLQKCLRLIHSIRGL